MGASPMQETARSTSHEIVNGVVLAVLEQWPCGKLHVVQVMNSKQSSTGSMGAKPLSKIEY
jgi:hypothetical protein